MNYNHTPTTEEVRQHWTDIGFGGDGPSFDRWLAEELRQAKEQAWDEVINAMKYEDGTPVELVTNINPYAKDTP